MSIPTDSHYIGSCGNDTVKSPPVGYVENQKLLIRKAMWPAASLMALGVLNGGWGLLWHLLDGVFRAA